MIIVDSNVISELVRPKPHPNVERWARTTHPRQLHTTAICEAELLAGVALMPPGRRRTELEAAIGEIFNRAFADRILPFSSAAAAHYASVIARRSQLGRPVKQADAQIAAICLLHQAAIAARDAGGFENLGIEIFNPWME